MQARRFEDTLLGFILKYWVVWTVILGSIVTAVYSIRTVDAHSLSLRENTNKISDLRERVVKLETIAQEIPEMKKDIKAILREVKR